jgi:hypothetical protein
MTDQTNTMLCLVIAASVLSFVIGGAAFWYRSALHRANKELQSCGQLVEYWYDQWENLDEEIAAATAKRSRAGKIGRQAQIARHRALVAKTTAKLRMEIAA